MQLAENFAPPLPTLPSAIELVTPSSAQVVPDQAMTRLAFSNCFENDLKEALDYAREAGYTLPSVQTIETARDIAQDFALLSWRVSDFGRRVGLNVDTEALPDGSIEVLFTHKSLTGRVLFTVDAENEFVTRVMVDSAMNHERVRIPLND